MSSGGFKSPLKSRATVCDCLLGVEGTRSSEMRNSSSESKDLAGSWSEDLASLGSGLMITAALLGCVQRREEQNVVEIRSRTRTSKCGIIPLQNFKDPILLASVVLGYMPHFLYQPGVTYIIQLMRMGLFPTT